MGEKSTQLAVRVVISLGLMGAGLFILIGGDANDGLEKAATGWIGLVLGYWLR